MSGTDRRLLIVNADDFGFTTDVNEGIIAAHTQGILTATTLMADGDAFEHAVELAFRHPKLDVGAHLQIVQGPNYPRSVSALLLALLRNEMDVIGQFDRQMNRILRAGIRPSHLDTHKHTHLHPTVLNAVLEMSKRYQVPWIRQPFDALPAKGLEMRAKNALLRSRRHSFLRAIASAGARTTDHFVGFAWTGNFSANLLAADLPLLPPGSTEFMCHPGVLGPSLRAAATRLKQSRAEELRALTSTAVRQVLEQHNIRLATYSDLTATLPHLA